MTTALVLGTLLALAGLAYVLYPLFAETPLHVQPQRRKALENDAGRDDPIGALREIEFDRETGKLSDTDYESLKARYTERALAELRARDAKAARAASVAGAVAGAPADPGLGDDIAEALVRQVRARGLECADCGPRPEPDAIYCSDCGRYLPGACGSCGASITQPGARYCGSCGESLAA